MAYRKTTKRYSTRSRKTANRGYTRRASGRKSTRRKSRRNNQRGGTQTIRLVVEQVSANPFGDNGQLQTQTGLKKAAF